MHSFSWWRMVVRVMECKGGAPLINEIKIFKHCFTILLGPHTLSLLPTHYTEQAGLYVTWQVCHYSCTASLSPKTEPRYKEEISMHHTFSVPYTAANHHCPDNHFEDIRDANSIDSRLPDHFRSLYLLPLRSFGLLWSHSAPIVWQWRM